MSQIQICPKCGEAGAMGDRECSGPRAASFTAPTGPFSRDDILGGIRELYEEWCVLKAEADHCDRVRLPDYEAMIEQLDKTMSTQPMSIESAPKNGTEILAWRKDAGWLLARWIAPCDFLHERELERMELKDTEEADWFYADFISGGRLDGADAPTHWLPLPDAPCLGADFAPGKDKTQCEVLKVVAYDKSN